MNLSLCYRVCLPRLSIRRINTTYPGETSKEIDNVGGVFINLEISKCWSLEISRRLFNILLLTTSNWRVIPEQNIKGIKAYLINVASCFRVKFCSSCVKVKSDDESLSDEDVPKDCKESYDSNLDESTFLVTPLSDSNEDECLAPGDDIEFLLHHDPSTPMISVASILEGFTDGPPLEENDYLFDLESKENEWKNILYDDLMSEDKVFDPEIYEKSFSLTFVKLTFEDRHYFPITFVIRIFLPYLTYSVDSSFLLSSGSEDTIFDPGISTFHFSSLKLVAYENPMVIFPFFYFCPKDKGIRGELS
ncbi:hypothetical protein Tco_0237830 [Tanacetum coccineum]